MLRIASAAVTLSLLAAFAACTTETTTGNDSPANTSDAGGEGGPARDGGGPTATIDCEVTVVGGGAGGLHSAFRLGTTLKGKVCLFEKEKELGGRILDRGFEDNAGPEAVRIGVGARRVMETQQVLFDLATELGLELEKPPLLTDLIQVKTATSFSKDEIATKIYPAIPAPPTDKDKETIIYDLLRASPERAKLPSADYPTFATYIKKVAGEDQFNFILGVSRFRADFEYDLDARGYLDYLDEEWDTCCQPSYPKGGMSAFIRGMEAKATAAGVRIFKDEAVTSIVRKAGSYEVATAKQKVNTRKLILATPPDALPKISGDVVDRIKSQTQFQQIVGVRVVTITQFWNEAWWKQIKNPTVQANAEVWRAWTTEHCLNFIEIPVEPYADPLKVTRSVYVDSARCATYWEDLNKQGIAKVEEELGKGLTALFNNGGVSSPATITIPKPTKTVFQVWPAAWHWLKAGATITNAQLADWAVEPLKDEPIALVGEAYFVNRSGWSDGAYKSSIKLLNAKYGTTLPGLKKQLRPMASMGSRYFGSYR